MFAAGGSCAPPRTQVLHSFVSASRFIYSFARDRGFPGPLNPLLAYVEPRTQAPLGAIIAFLIGGIAFATAWTNESPTVAFAAVSGINANAFLMVYGLPCLLRATTSLRTFKAVPGFDLGRLSVPIAVLGAMYGAFSNATIALPMLYPIIQNNINYAPIALAAVILMAVIFYPFAVKLPAWGYKGPALVAPKPGEPSVRGGTQEAAAVAEPAAEAVAAPEVAV